MKIAIVGAGAMGSLFGGLLAKSGEDVWLFDPVFEEHIKQINRHGLIIEEENTEHLIEVQATTEVNKINQTDLVVIFVKAPDTKKAIQDALPTIGEETKVLSLQNGLGITGILSEYILSSKVLRGVTSHGSTLIKPGKICHAGKGVTKIGKVKVNGSINGVKRIIEMLNRAGIQAQYVEDIKKAIWNKLLINVGINALTAVFEVINGTLVRDSELRQIMRATVLEGMAMAEKVGLELDEKETIDKVEEVCRLTAKNRSSMLQDLKAGRKTEIDYINGAVVNKGKELGINTPLNALLTRLVKQKS